MTRWTREEIEDLETFWNQNVLEKKIGEFLGRSEASVKCKVWKLKLPKRRISSLVKTARRVKAVRVTFTKREWDRMYTLCVDTGVPIHKWGREVMLKAIESDNLEA